jgi:RNA polymerase sigma factor for flagellar operon FliA
MNQTTSQPQLSHDVARRMIPTVHRIAHQLARRLPRHIRIDDLVGAGCQGLVSAISRFDPERGEGFDSYAEFRIRGSMLDELRSADPLSRDQRGHSNKIAAASRALHARLGRAPAADEIAAELGISLDAYWERLSSVTTGQTASIDAESDDDKGPAFHLLDPHAEPADENLSRKETRQAINRAIAALPPRLGRVLDLHYVEGLTLQQIGALLGVSESRVCQIETDAIRRIRALCPDYVADAPTARRPSAPVPRRGRPSRRAPSASATPRVPGHSLPPQSALAA